VSIELEAIIFAHSRARIFAMVIFSMYISFFAYNYDFTNSYPIVDKFPGFCFCLAFLSSRSAAVGLGGITGLLIASPVGVAAAILAPDTPKPVFLRASTDALASEYLI
jgi:hypothetical protein